MKDWDPKPSERTYYRSSLDGQRGYLVKRGGVECIRLDRPAQELIEKLDASWRLDSQAYPITPHRAAKIAFVADRELCGAIGKYTESKVDWLDLPEKQRIAFMEDGPGDDGIRDKLFQAVMGTLKELTGG